MTPYSLIYNYFIVQVKKASKIVGKSARNDKSFHSRISGDETKYNTSTLNKIATAYPNIAEIRDAIKLLKFNKAADMFRYMRIYSAEILTTNEKFQLKSFILTSSHLRID